MPRRTDFRSTGICSGAPRANTSRPRPVAVDQSGRRITHGLKPLEAEGQSSTPFPRRTVHRPWPAWGINKRDFRIRQPGGHHQIISRELDAGCLRARSMKAIYCSASARTEMRVEIDTAGCGQDAGEGRVGLRNRRYRRPGSPRAGPRIGGLVLPQVGSIGARVAGFFCMSPPRYSRLPCP